MVEEDDGKIDKISCETIKGAVSSKEDEIAYLKELKTIYDATQIHDLLDKLITTCEEQKRILNELNKNTCPIS
jgi:hypothetical protein